MLEARDAFDWQLKLDPRIRLTNLEETNSGHSLWARISLRNEPLSMLRDAEFGNTLSSLDKAAAELQDALPRHRDDFAAELVDLPNLKPVYPLAATVITKETREWAKVVIHTALSGCSVVLVDEYPARIDFALAAIASSAAEYQLSLARPKLLRLDPSSLLELAQTAPGLLTVAVTTIAMTTNPYSISTEIANLLSEIRDRGVLFSGRPEEVNTLLGSVQGHSLNPLNPVVMRVCDIDGPRLTDFVVDDAVRGFGGLSGKSFDKVVERCRSQLFELQPDDLTRLAPHVARHAVATVASSDFNIGEHLASVRDTAVDVVAKEAVVANQSTTMSLCEPSLKALFKDRLFAQDDALDELGDHLATEALTRPSHQPIRYCAQGTPGTGKSESAGLVAEFLGIPFVNIDAASLSDVHTASAQLLGAGRGIVDSNRPGVLEEAARHRHGAVVEVSDLDHAPAHVRSHVGDLFLRALETGSLQSGTGAVIPCGKLILAFTVNLPDGADERIYRPLGFHDVCHTDQGTLKADVAGQLSVLLSSALMSRLGSPILFSPLSGEAIELIVRRSVEKAMTSALNRLGYAVDGCAVEKGCVAFLRDALPRMASKPSARGIQEHVRHHCAAAVIAFHENKTSPIRIAMDGGSIVVDMAP